MHRSPGLFAYCPRSPIPAGTSKIFGGFGACWMDFIILRAYVITPLIKPNILKFPHTIVSWFSHMFVVDQVIQTFTLT